MPQYHDPETKTRPFWASLIYTKEGDLDFSWVLALLMGLAGVFGFVWVIVACSTAALGNILAAWSFLGGAFASVLLAAVPIAKAKIMANATLPSNLAKDIGDAGHVIETSTDISEIKAKLKG